MAQNVFLPDPSTECGGKFLASPAVKDNTMRKLVMCHTGADQHVHLFSRMAQKVFLPDPSMECGGKFLASRAITDNTMSKNVVMSNTNRATL